MRNNTLDTESKNRYIGCVIGAAIGDSMGYVSEVLADEYVDDPVVDENTNLFPVSDDTQMSLFTMDGLMWAYIRCSSRGIGSYEASGVWQSYARWYYTQTGVVLDEYVMHKHEHEPIALSSIGVKTIIEYDEFYSNRGASEETLFALATGQMGKMEEPLNDFKDASCLTRVAPVGLFLHDKPDVAFNVAARLAAITHGNPSGYLAAGTYACIIAEILNGKSLDACVRNALLELKRYLYIDEVNDVLEYALHLSECDIEPAQAIELIGTGSSSEDILAIGVYCALKSETYEDAVRWAVNCGGVSSSIGFVAGSLIGALKGDSVIPTQWQQKLELHQMMLDWIDKLYKLREI